MPLKTEPVVPNDKLGDGKGFGTHPMIRWMNLVGYAVSIAAIYFNVKDYGAIGDGVHDDRAAIQAAIDAAADAANPGTVFFPPGDYLVNGTLFITVSSALLGSGRGARIFFTANAPGIACTAPCYMDGLTLFGSNNPAFTLQDLIYVNSNLVTANHCAFADGYNSIHITGSSFYGQYEFCNFFGVVNAHIFGDGVAAPGYAFQMGGCQMIPNVGTYCMDLSNLGSLAVSSTVMSPANCTENCVRIRTVAPLAGTQTFTQVVFEGGAKSALRLDGTALNPIRFVYVTQCNLNQGAGFDAIHLGFARDIFISDSYLSGLQRAVGINDVCERIHIDNTSMLSVGNGIHGYAGATITDLHCANSDYINAGAYLDLSAMAAANITRVSVVNGARGTAVVPFVLPAAMAAQQQLSVVPEFWRTWVPVVTNSIGAAGAFTINEARYTIVGKRCSVSLRITVTAAGGGGFLTVTLPFTGVATSAGTLMGVEIGVTGSVIGGNVSGAGCLLRTYNTGPLSVLNYQPVVSGTYEVA